MKIVSFFLFTEYLMIAIIHLMTTMFVVGIFFAITTKDLDMLYAISLSSGFAVGGVIAKMLKKK